MSETVNKTWQVAVKDHRVAVTVEAAYIHYIAPEHGSDLVVQLKDAKHQVVFEAPVSSITYLRVPQAESALAPVQRQQFGETVQRTTERRAVIEREAVLGLLRLTTDSPFVEVEGGTWTVVIGNDGVFYKITAELGEMPVLSLMPCALEAVDEVRRRIRRPEPELEGDAA